MANIFNEYKTINQTAEALNVIKILINYVKTTLPKGETNINEFMRKIYIAKNSESNSLTANITDNCQLNHLKNLWFLLMMRKAYLFSINNLDPFESLNENFKQHQSDIDLSITPSPTLTLSLGFIIFQMIENKLNSAESAEHIGLISKTK
jgi:hypothetical protein